MNPRPLTSDLSVSPQISATDVASLKALGYGAIVCHRPDGESSDQPNFEEIAQAARQAGLQAVHQPVVPGQASAEQAAGFAALCAELPKPILAYCRTGTRSATLWALSQADKVPNAEIQERAA
ncbi:MAG: TIGR01244 family sulfur transferase, partial [Pseudomonadales bacterium]